MMEGKLWGTPEPNRQVLHRGFRAGRLGGRLLWQRLLRESKSSAVTAGVDEIHPELLKFLDIIGLSW